MLEVTIIEVTPNKWEICKKILPKSTKQGKDSFLISKETFIYLNSSYHLTSKEEPPIITTPYVLLTIMNN